MALDLFAVVVHIHRNCTADLLKAVGSLELTITQTKLLHYLNETGPELSLGEAAEQLQVSLPAVSRLVDDLVRRGMVERHEDAADRRMKRVRLTESGRATIRRLNGARLSGLGEFVSTLTEPERTKLADALAALLERPEVAACRIEGTAE
jgi:DNA-binding MarR family transcriptional regulator